MTDQEKEELVKELNQNFYYVNALLIDCMAKSFVKINQKQEKYDDVQKLIASIKHDMLYLLCLYSGVKHANKAITSEIIQVCERVCEQFS